jgi:exodeoxyribonuclease-3
MKIISYNVNGIRAVTKKPGFKNLLKRDYDIICLQETRINFDFDIPGSSKYMYQYWSHSIKPGHSGTAVLSKIKPLDVTLGIGHHEFDDLGRVITCRFKNFTLINVYVVNAGVDSLARLKLRQKWDIYFNKYIKKVSKQCNGKVIVCGDFNSIVDYLDYWKSKEDSEIPRTAGMTIEERTGLKQIMKSSKLIDSFRYVNKDLRKYTYISFRTKNPQKGMRIDHFLVSEKLIKKVKKCDIDNNVKISDHFPIILNIDL